MALASYNDLKAAIATELHRSDLTTPIEDFILRGEKRINREIRASEMETAYTGTIAAGVIAVPTDFLEWKVVYIDAAKAQRLEPKAWEWVLDNYGTRSASGLPKFIARNGSNFEFGPYPDSTYSVKGTYYKRPAAVSSSWHSLASTNPDLYLYAALIESTAHIGDDPRLGIWKQAYDMARDAINAEAQMQNISGAPLRVTFG